MSNDIGYTGQRDVTSGGSQYNALMFFVEQVLSRVSTSYPARVVACTNDGGISPAGKVDVLPLINQLDGAGNATPHGIVHGLPYSRLQGGANAVIIDPQPGDVGIVICASRDISSLQGSGEQTNPGSGRRFDMADGIYVGFILNGAPTQYVAFTSDGISVVSPAKITLQAPEIEIDASTSTTITTPQATLNASTTINGPLSQGTGTAGGDATLQGPLTVVNDVTAGGKSVEHHTHLEHGAGSQTSPPT